MAVCHNKLWLTQAAQDMWLAQRASHILTTGPNGQQKFADLKMKPQLVVIGELYLTREYLTLNVRYKTPNLLFYYQ